MFQPLGIRAKMVNQPDYCTDGGRHSLIPPRMECCRHSRNERISTVGSPSSLKIFFQTSCRSGSENADVNGGSFRADMGGLVLWLLDGAIPILREPPDQLLSVREMCGRDERTAQNNRGHVTLTHSTRVHLAVILVPDCA